MRSITTLGIDLAKDSFYLHGVDENGAIVIKKPVSRAKLSKEIVKLSPCLIGMEACGSAHYWARKFKDFGHEVKLMSPQFVKPYVKSNKNDSNDAEAICEAVTRPSMRFVGVKSLKQQDIQSLHRVRSHFVKERTALMNSIRGLLAEYGVVFPKGMKALKEVLSSSSEYGLTNSMEAICKDYLKELDNKNKQIDRYEKKIEAIFASNEVCKRIESIPGIGKQTATILYTLLGDEGSSFKNGREFAAYLGLVPKQCSTGSRQTLLGISKRGDKYTRSLLVHGGRSVVYHAKKKDDSRSKWIQNLLEKKGVNKTVVAIANRNARIAWAIVKNETTYNVKTKS